MLDRLIHRVFVIEANGESFRFKSAKKTCQKRIRSNSQKARLPSTPLTTYCDAYIMNPMGASLLDRYRLTSRPPQTKTMFPCGEAQTEGDL